TADFCASGVTPAPDPWGRLGIDFQGQVKSRFHNVPGRELFGRLGEICPPGTDRGHHMCGGLSFGGTRMSHPYQARHRHVSTRGRKASHTSGLTKAIRRPAVTSSVLLAVIATTAAGYQAADNRQTGAAAFTV